jgi:hypothetical protein
MEGIMKRLISGLIVAACFLASASESFAVKATGQRRIKQPLVGHNANDLHFITYQADVNTAWIEGWTIDISEPFTNKTEVPDDWPFTDGKWHSVEVDVTGMNVAPDTWVNIDVEFDLNEYNSVKFNDIYWTYSTHAPVDALSGVNIGWGLQPNPGSSLGGYVIGKYDIYDTSGNLLGVDLIGHEYTTSELTSFGNLLVYNASSSTQTAIISGGAFAHVDYLPTFDEIYNRTSWDIIQSQDLVLNPGESGAPVPEPNTIILLGVGLIGIMKFKYNLKTPFKYTGRK